MRLSEAMRLGATLVPQCEGSWFVKSGRKIKAACAIGSAYLAIGKHVVDYSSGKPAFPELRLKYNVTLLKYNATLTLAQQIMHLNDISMWSRERIADWLDSLPMLKDYYAKREKDTTSCDIEQPDTAMLHS